MSGPSFDEVREVVEKLPCPTCKAADAMTLTRQYHSRPVGTFSLAGQQMKFSAFELWIAECSACDTVFNVSGKPILD